MLSKLTMARGNCKSKNNDIAGNILSEVNGCDDVAAATAKELKATSTTHISEHVIITKLQVTTYGEHQ